MRIRWSCLAFGVLMIPACLLWAQEDEVSSGKAVRALDFKVQDIDGREVDLSTYQGQVLLVVNVASRCGYTPQYKDLEALYRKYKDRGFNVLAFPSNDFGQQEPGSDKQIKEFCKSRYDVTFDLFSKSAVTGDRQAPLYRFLTDRARHGRLGGDIRWNFTKFLIDRSGAVVARFEPGDTPMGDKIVQAVEKSLAESPAKPAVDGSGRK